MIDGQAYDESGAYKRKIIGVAVNSLGLCYVRRGKECLLLASSTEISLEAKAYIDKMFYLY